MTKLIDAAARFSLALAVTTGLTLAVPVEARAADAQPAPADKATEVADIGLRTVGYLGYGGAYLSMGVSGYYRPHRNVGVGGYFDGSFTGDALGGDACFYDDYGCSRGMFRAGAAARFDVLPSYVVDPWVGVEAGAVWLRSNGIDEAHSLRVVGDLEADLGIDVRVPYVSFGPYGLVSAALGADGVTFGRVGVGFRVAARF
ncbi:hypothetical protein [Polyangium sp. 6x1]|uniref:hypothetical protein n=1 Tax=Polyangium sp. 6x1 TaxID=3042689 RepID=UPI0024822F3D|nr:hypothetical protein [Polyangium sp. 6x1]MDI1446997.1 hypothetical protein [Polyangium sp. 6x1]